MTTDDIERARGGNRAERVDALQLATTLIGQYVVIDWTDEDGAEQSAAGHLESIDLDRAERRVWAMFDWGYGVDLFADGLTIRKATDDDIIEDCDA